MLNFRKLKKDFSPNILKEGRELFEKGMVESTKILTMDSESIRLSSRVTGNFENAYENEVEIDRIESMTTDSNCDCPYSYDCQHLAAVLFYLEKHLDKIVVKFSQTTNLEESEEIDEEEKEELLETFEKAANKENKRRTAKFQKEVLEEYIKASKILSESPLFTPAEKFPVDKAELAVIFSPNLHRSRSKEEFLELQIALRLPFRSKPLHIPSYREFCEAVRYQTPLTIAGKRYFFTSRSFEKTDQEILYMLLTHSRFPEDADERSHRFGWITLESFGHILSQIHKIATKNVSMVSYSSEQEELPLMPCLYCDNLETPLRFSPDTASLSFTLERLDTPETKLFINPHILIRGEGAVPPSDTLLFDSVHTGVISDDVYYRFPPRIKRVHLQHLEMIRSMTIPIPLFGTFVENSLPQLANHGEISNPTAIESFVTIPFVEHVKARCDIRYLDGELDAALFFIYEDVEIPAAPRKLTFSHLDHFVSDEGILARDLGEEQRIIHTLFQGFIFDEAQGLFVTKTEKRIVEFMTEIIPNNQHRITFDCPENLLDQFTYDSSKVSLHLKESEKIGKYELELSIEGDLKGITLDVLWECLSSQKNFIELQKRQSSNRKKSNKNAKPSKILVLDLQKLSPLIQLFDDLGVKKLENQTVERPLWSLISLQDEDFEKLPLNFSMTKKLRAIREQILGKESLKPSAIPKKIDSLLRCYQREGIHWLEKLRTMHLNGVLADDMGLGKTLQAITAITQYKKLHKEAVSLVICPTSLVYNWKEEFHKFNPLLKVLIVDGTPTQRKKLLKTISRHDIVITSYTLLQKDIDTYQKTTFGYAVLDEAQHIKNRATRNAKSVKMIEANHRLILTGTPIENSLEELWSLFDFLMPGLLSSYPRFVEKYLRNPHQSHSRNMDILRQKVSPFVLRRMKSDVLQDLPPISEITYRCQLTEQQQALYRSYAQSAREELTSLVKKEGFEKVHIHVLATLTRLKQICCHPAIFAKETAEAGDSAKYEMLMELLQTLTEGQHKTVIFSQYTKMLNIIRKDLEKMGIRFSYLDGTSKNRLQIVKNFNEDLSIPIFLVSLKAGGSGLNITGADSVIHYDMWWNPAVENQATDRVHRIGQTKSVSSYKLITLSTIEEKILELQNRKRGLVKSIISNDEEALNKLTWEEVLELLQT